MAVNVKKNDTVVVISGKNRGEKGTVTKVKGGKVVVDGINKAKKHEKPNANNQTGGIVDKEMPIHISNVMVVDSKTGKADRVKRQREAGKSSVRVSVRGNNILD
jgi:large subunit ribosomal protein L24